MTGSARMLGRALVVLVALALIYIPAAMSPGTVPALAGFVLGLILLGRMIQVAINNTNTQKEQN